MTQAWEIENFLDVRDSQMHIDGVSAVDLAREYGTPLFVFSESRIRHNIARLQNVAGIQMVPVHYRGATPSLNDVMGGHTNMMLISVSSALPNFRAGQVKMIGIGSEKRLPQVADVPTIAESGKLPGFIAGTWFGMAATGGTPRDIVMKINADVRKIVADPAFHERFLERQLYEPMTSSPDEFVSYIKSELQNWTKVIREQNLAIAH